MLGTAYNISFLLWHTGLKFYAHLQWDRANILSHIILGLFCDICGTSDINQFPLLLQLDPIRLPDLILIGHWIILNRFATINTSVNAKSSKCQKTLFSYRLLYRIVYAKRSTSLKTVNHNIFLKKLIIKGCMMNFFRSESLKSCFDQILIVFYHEGFFSLILFYPVSIYWDVILEWWE